MVDFNLLEKKDIVVFVFYWYEVPRIVKFLETEGRTVVTRGGVTGKWGNSCLMGLKFEFRKLKKL